jgi:hypothetical protein
MNLYDLIGRNDFSLEKRGEISAVVFGVKGGPRHRGIRMGAGSWLRVKDAHRMSASARSPEAAGWSCLTGAIEFNVEEHGDGYDLKVGAPVDTHLSVGRFIDPRAPILGQLQGYGIEVGPGLRPIVRPNKDVDVEYVEECSPAEWHALYAKGRDTPEALSEDILLRYRIGSAVTLEQWPAHSMDFVFSNHVFEHLMNPMQVLQNWRSRLKTGAIIAGVIPDARYTFDCRQPFSTMNEFRNEHRRGCFDVPDEKYERWVRYTSPSSTVTSLKERAYSIHVHYYTPDVFRALVDEALDEPEIEFITERNNKDFGFVLRT